MNFPKLVIIVFCLTAIGIPAYAYAAKEIKGTVPEVQPLQPAPEGVAPNYSGNVNFKDPSVYAAPVEDEGVSEVLKSNETPDQQSAPNGNNRVQSRSSGFLKLLSFAVFIIILLGGGLYFWRREK